MRIDVQTHWLPRSWLEAWRGRTEIPHVEVRGDEYLLTRREGVGMPVDHRLYDLDRKVEDMRSAGIDMAAVSLTICSLEEFARDEAVALARDANDQVAQLGRDYRDRFIPLATLPMSVPEACVPELERSVIDLGMSGVQVFDNTGGIDPDARRFWPIYRRMVELDVPMVLHPNYPYGLADRLGEFRLIPTIGFMMDTWVAVSRMIFSGMLDEFPDLRIVVPHLAAGLPFMMGRLDHSYHAARRAGARLTQLPSEYFQRLYLDTVSCHAPALMMAYQYLGPDRLLFASDCPYWESMEGVESLEALPIPEADKRKIFSENATRVFKLKVPATP